MPGSLPTCGFNSTWIGLVMKKFDIGPLFDEFHWKKEEIVRDYGRRFLSYTSEHLLLPRGDAYDIFSGTKTPEWKLMFKTLTIVDKYHIYDVYHWDQATGRYDNLGSTIHLFDIAVFCEWQSLGHPWEQEYPDPRLKPELYQREENT